MDHHQCRPHSHRWAADGHLGSPVDLALWQFVRRHWRNSELHGKECWDSHRRHDLVRVCGGHPAAVQCLPGGALPAQTQAHDFRHHFRRLASLHVLVPHRYSPALGLISVIVKF